MPKIKIFGSPEQQTIDQMNAFLKYGGEHAVLCADSHLGYSMPVGGVVAYEKQICVNGVGFDIACGNKAVLLDSCVADVHCNIYRNMNEIAKNISFGVGRINDEPVEHELFDDPVWDDVDLLRTLKDKAVKQLGTVGSGNHYVDVFFDELDRVWVGVHFGSRGLGHTICTHFIKAAGGKDGVHAAPVILHEDSELGSQYIKCMELAGRYAYAGRDWVCQRVAKILRAEILEEIHNHHNFAWRERHFGKDLWVIRKGATPAFPDQHGFVGGSMVDKSFIIKGIDGESSREALYSTVHGAGRLLGRTAALGKVDRRTGKQLTPGLVSREMHDAWIKRAAVEVRGADLDESPLAYKRIEDVISAHEGTVQVVHTLTPIGVAMAPSNIRDPYKD
jgi:tRNA-splicing ligase RtcB